MKKNFNFFFVLLSLIFLNLNVHAFEENGKGTVDLANYTSFEEEKNQIIKDAKVLACKNALQKYASTFTIDKKKNYEKIKSKVNDNYSQYMVCDSVIDENLDVGENKFTILMKANIDENKIDQALVEVSAIANAGADEVSDIVILMFSAKTKSVKQKDDKVIFGHLAELSDGKIVINPEDEVLSASENLIRLTKKRFVKGSRNPKNKKYRNPKQRRK